MDISLFINSIYIISALFFIAGLKMMTSPSTARSGNMISASGMLIAILTTLLEQGIIDYKWIFLGIIIGSIIGVFASRMIQMTEMPELVAILHSFVGLAAVFIGFASYLEGVDFTGVEKTIHDVEIYLGVLIGGVTFTGSVVR